MAVSAWISEINFKSGLSIKLNKNDVVVFVGPNNSGKSTVIKELFNILAQNLIGRKLVESIAVGKDGSPQEFLELLESINMGGTQPWHYRGYRYDHQGTDPIQLWSQSNMISPFTQVFANLLTTTDRLTLVNPAKNIQLTKEPANHPIHFLQRDDGTEKKFSNYFFQAFGMDLVVHRNAGSLVPLYVGKRPLPRSGEDRLSVAYLKEIEKLDLLHEQGDGMKSFVGVLLNAFISTHSIEFIDEPDAFLHPPQARLLGKMLVKDLPSERQLFLATHSEDFLKGLLDAQNSRLKVIRIQRNGNTNKISLLENAEIAQLWGDPILRYSNILSGLFHSKVVLCESDSDCRFYSALLQTHFDGTPKLSPDILFTHCGGKQRLPVVIKSLVKLDVQIQVVADFDILNEEYPLRAVFESLGGIWINVEADWKLVKSSVEQKKPELETKNLKETVEQIFASEAGTTMSKTGTLNIQKALKKASAWQIAKETGKAYIPSGDATRAFDRIQQIFKERGLIILEVGELEGFDKSVGNHGPKWVNSVLDKDLKNDDSLEDARRFVKQLL